MDSQRNKVTRDKDFSLIAMVFWESNTIKDAFYQLKST